MKTRVIGVGNEFRGDDGLGRQVARELRKFNPKDTCIEESSGESLSLMEMWADAERVILVDAIQSGAEPGAILRFEVAQQALPVEILRQCSTHGASVPEAIELARALGRLPKEMVFYGIEGLCFDHGHSLSQIASVAVGEAVNRIRAELLDNWVSLRDRAGNA